MKTNHIPESELLKKLNDAKKLIKVSGKYSHYKNPNQFYTILDLAIDEATENVSVIYQAQYGNKIIFIRSLESFLTKGKFMLQSAK
jgi:hypothetical protein